MKQPVSISNSSTHLYKFFTVLAVSATTSSCYFLKKGFDISSYLNSNCTIFVENNLHCLVIDTFKTKKFIDMKIFYKEMPNLLFAYRNYTLIVGSLLALSSIYLFSAAYQAYKDPLWAQKLLKKKDL